MSITDELREYAHDCCARVDDAIHDIADRIDAEHKKACDDAWDNGYEADYLDIEKWLAEHPQAMEHHGWVHLPLDADGEIIHVGDMMERGKACGHVIALMLSEYPKKWGGELHWGVQLEGEQAPTALDAFFKHYHEPTVEDVMVEFATDWEHAQDGEDKTAVLKEYAKRLRLAESEDA